MPENLIALCLVHQKPCLKHLWGEPDLTTGHGELSCARGVWVQLRTLYQVHLLTFDLRRPEWKVLGTVLSLEVPQASAGAQGPP